MNTWVIGDLHFGHRNIGKFRPEFSSEPEHRRHVVRCWNDTVKKGGDRIFVLGDAAFTMEGLETFAELRGRKFLIRGNHDELSTNLYLAFFEEVYGMVAYKNAWLTHAPIHPDELRGRVNVHGHVHSATIQDADGWNDPRYFNACPEAIGYAPVPFRDLVPAEAKS